MALKEYQQSHPGSKAMILCGDFNTEPTEAAYDLVVRGEIGEDTKEKMRKEYDIKVRPHDHKLRLFLSQNFKLV